MNCRLLVLLAVSWHAIALGVTINTLTPLGDPLGIGLAVAGLDWCDGCNYLAASGINENHEGLINVYSFDATSLTLITSYTITGSSLFYETVWCDDCNYLAASGQNENAEGLIKIFSFDTETLTSVTSYTIAASSAFASLAWCDDCSYLAASGYNENNEGLIKIFSFDTVNLSQVLSYTTENIVWSPAWCDGCNYLALGVSESDTTVVNLYSFDSTNSSLNFVTSQTLTLNEAVDKVSVSWCGDCSYLAVAGSNDSKEALVRVYQFTAGTLMPVAEQTLPATSAFSSLAWCGDNCEYIAVGGKNSSAQAVLNLYQFDSGTNNLSLITSQVTTGSVVFPLAWCGNCTYLAAGENTFGEDGAQLLGAIQLFKTNALSAPTLHAQKSCHRFPSQVDIVNTICWNAVTDAVSYKVYADEGLTVVLAQITKTPYCYSQHQIIPGTIKTYYVTAVDANGDESSPASITI